MINLTDLQLIGPPGAELDLRTPNQYLLLRDNYQLDIDDDLALTKIPGGVLLTRDDKNYETLTRHLYVFGAGRQEQKTSLRALQTILTNASLYDRYRGFRGEAAFFTERLGNESSAVIRQVVTGRLREISREGVDAYLDYELKLILRNPL